MLWRCSVCRKAGLEEDFVFVPVDDTHETIYCYDCAPEKVMRQIWPEDEETLEQENSP